MNEHAIDVTINQIGDDIIMTMRIVGKLKHSDYEFLVPTLQHAIEGVREPKIKALVDIVDFSGYELRALWDDLKFGVQFNKEFSKIAVIGNKFLEEFGVTIANWFTHADMKYFEVQEDAISWLGE